MGEDLGRRTVFQQTGCKGQIARPAPRVLWFRLRGRTPGNEAGMYPGINDLTNSAHIADWVGEERQFSGLTAESKI